MFRIVLLSLALASPALASPEAPLPGLADVKGVAANDILNIRAEPNATSQILGTLAPDATEIEIVDFDPSGKWARVSAGEVSGWASGKFLRLRPDTWTAGNLPPGLRCVGTEPFWSLSTTADGMRYATPESDPRNLRLRTVTDRGIPQDTTRALIASDDAGRITALIEPRMCSDGMSDRQFGLGAMLLLEDGNTAPRMLGGCCSIGN